MIKKLILAGIIVMSTVDAPAQKCNPDIIQSDADVWAIASNVSGFREWFCHESVFNLKEDEWNDEWGMERLTIRDLSIHLIKCSRPVFCSRMVSNGRLMMF